MNCQSCGARLGFWRRTFGRGVCADCERKQRERVATAHHTYEQVAGAIAAGTQDAQSAAPLLTEAARVASLSAEETKRINAAAFRQFADRVLADDHLTEQEEAELTHVCNTFGFDGDGLQADFHDLAMRIVIARANAGSLPVLPAPHLICKKGEVVHAEMNAILMKHQTQREYAAGYSGFSFRVTKGVRYHVGGARGHSVVTGTKLVASDAGILAVSSQRVAFMGADKTIEMPYSKIVNINVFTDGIQFHLSNRQSAPLFQLENGEVIAALTNAAMQKTLESRS